MEKKVHNWRRVLRRKLAAATTISLFVVAPMLCMMSVGQADPPSRAPAWGYRHNQQSGHYRGRDRDDDDCDDRYDRDGRYDRDRRYSRDRCDYDDRDWRRDRDGRYDSDRRYDRDWYRDRDRRYDSDRYDRDRYERRDFRTLEGLVAEDLRGDSFILRLNNGQRVRVNVRGDEPRRLNDGDLVRVYGYFSNGVFFAQSLSILRNRR